MKIAFYGARPAGIIVLSSILALDHQVTHVFAEDLGLKIFADSFALPQYDYRTLNSNKTISDLKKKIDIFICCHGWTILNKQFVTTLKCINFHPCLYKYKGLHPIKRLIEDENPIASVATHFMTDKIDAGTVIYEEFKTISTIEKKTELEVYNELYPLYATTLNHTLYRIQFL